MTQAQPHNPSDEEAFQFALMLSAGLPADHAILYFFDTADAAELALYLSRWQRSKQVQKAQARLLGKSWQEMSLDEKIEAGLTQQYANLAYLCYSINYVSAGDRDKAKLDAAIKMLEAKKAGTAGQADALSVFLTDIKAGRVKLAGAAEIAGATLSGPRAGAR
jgi:hypothetical protein